MNMAKNTVAGLSNRYVSLANLQLSTNLWYLQALSHRGHSVIFPGPLESQISLLEKTDRKNFWAIVNLRWNVIRAVDCEKTIEKTQGSYNCGRY